MSSYADELVRTYVLAELHKAITVGYFEQFTGRHLVEDEDRHLSGCPDTRVNDPTINPYGTCSEGTCEEFDILFATLSCPHLAEPWEFRLDRPMHIVIDALTALEDRP